jgi:hypothetical protein
MWVGETKRAECLAGGVRGRIAAPRIISKALPLAMSFAISTHASGPMVTLLS